MKPNQRAHKHPSTFSKLRTAKSIGPSDQILLPIYSSPATVKAYGSDEGADGSAPKPSPPKVAVVLCDALAAPQKL